MASHKNDACHINTCVCACMCVRVSKCLGVCECGRLSAAMIVLMATWTEINWQAQINKYEAEKAAAAKPKCVCLKSHFCFDSSPFWALKDTRTLTHA